MKGGINIKPNYVYFYKNDSALNDILQYPPFSYDKPILIKRSKDEARFEYKYFDLRCYRLSSNMMQARGIKTWQILIEDELYDTLSWEYINMCLRPMMIPYELLGGRIVKINKYVGE